MAATFNELTESLRAEVGASGTISDGMVQLVAEAEGRFNEGHLAASSVQQRKKEKADEVHGHNTSEDEKKRNGRELWKP